MINVIRYKIYDITVKSKYTRFQLTIVIPWLRSINISDELTVIIDNAESPASSVETHDSGLYLGVGAGARLNLGEKLFLNLEYEWAYVANMYYGNGYLNSAQAGLGFKIQ
jgi:hypothetical protein